MLIEQPKNICVEAVEAPDLIDRLLVSYHQFILFKILDFVKYFYLYQQWRNYLRLGELHPPSLFLP